MISLLCCLPFAWSPSDMENIPFPALSHPCLASWPPMSPDLLDRNATLHTWSLAPPGPPEEGRTTAHTFWLARRLSGRWAHVFLKRAGAVQLKSAPGARREWRCSIQSAPARGLVWQGASQSRGAASSLPRVTNALLLKTASRAFPWANLTTGRVLAFHLLNTRTLL